MKRSSAMSIAPPEELRRSGGAGWHEEAEEGIVWLDQRRNQAGSMPSVEEESLARPRRTLGPLERELHDTVLQDLLCVSMGLSGLRSRPLDDGTRQEVEHLQEISAQAYERLRGLLSGKVQTSTPPRKMRDVLATCVRAFNLKAGAEVTLEVRDSVSSLAVSGEAARQAEMIVHEALCNAWRHGRARSIQVVLAETADIIWVKVIDDGKGFDTSIRRGGHYGLRIMRERADAIGARVGITSAPGKGTCVNLYLPSHHSRVPTTQEVSNGYSFAGR